MSIMELGALGEFVGAFAVVATLIYLAFQVRQNTKAMRANALQAVMEGSRDVHLFAAGNPQIRSITLKSRAGGELTEDEALAYSFHTNAILRNFQSAHFQLEEGLLDPAVFEAVFDGSMATLGGNPYFREFVDTAHITGSLRQRIKSKFPEETQQ